MHVHGVVRAIEDAEWTLNMLHRLTDAQESGRAQPWRVSDAPDDYVRQKLRAVGIELTIERLEGRLKLSQDEDLADRHGTVSGLKQQADSPSQAMAALVQRAIGD